jgi:hypothetical protein
MVKTRLSRGFGRQQAKAPLDLENRGFLLAIRGLPAVERSEARRFFQERNTPRRPALPFGSSRSHRIGAGLRDLALRLSQFVGGVALSQASENKILRKKSGNRSRFAELSANGHRMVGPRRH